MITLLGEPPLKERWSQDLRQVAASDEDRHEDGAEARAARRLEVFLDRVAAQAAADERSYVLDPRYLDLVPLADRPLVERLTDIGRDVAGAAPTWATLRNVLRSYGASF